MHDGIVNWMNDFDMFQLPLLFFHTQLKLKSRRHSKFCEKTYEKSMFIGEIPS